VRRDPSAAKKSEAIKPIIYYLDNGTPNQYEVLYWKVQVGGIKRLNQQVLLMLFRSKFYLKMQINGSSFQYDKTGCTAQRVGVLALPLILELAKS
jgi:hypothetical protein